MSGNSHTIPFLRANPEFHPFIKWLIGYDKEEWTTVDLKRDYPAYNPNTVSHILRKLWKYDVIRRVKRISTPGIRENKLYSVWSLNVNCLDKIKRVIEETEE